jgi:hypothetical protein
VLAPERGLRGQRAAPALAWPVVAAVVQAVATVMP